MPGPTRHPLGATGTVGLPAVHVAESGTSEHVVTKPPTTALYAGSG